ncbi:GntR family transcriptional regulator [Curtobacterium pusillum]|jgi:DNA-binding GntR family transcriptional regulator|uniref:GntR family transcriptional regulator n=1 Tax=Curtobacterium pusillum TaxID=69373 RepID=UPI0011A0B5DA|nr:GntR family transcriptional regulator [Curtobacterium pusillum]
MPLPGSAAQPAGRTFLRDRAYDALFQAIQTSQLVPGEVLRDDELMEWLGMSRTPIRHALIRLAESGLIEMSAGRQTTVAELAPERTNRALFVSGICNEYAVVRLIGSDAPGVADELATQRAEVAAGVEAGDGPRIARGIGAFFDVLTNRIGNPELERQVRRIDAELARFLAPGDSTTPIDTEWLRRGVESVHDAFVADDPDAARAALRELYAPTHRDFLERFREPEID